MTSLRPSPASIGMGELAIAKAPDVLEIRGLGSCIALALHDPLQRLAGLAHIVIPRPLPNTPPAPAWAATDAVPTLLAKMEEHGGRASRIVARLAGGSSMFPGQVKGYDVGRANADIVESLLRAYHVPVLSRQVGGNASRSVRLHAEDGRLEVKTGQGLSIGIARRHEPDPTESARILLEAAAAPLADLLQRPVAVDATGRHELTGPETIEFLGPRTPMRWSRLDYAARGGGSSLHVVIPDLHARGIDDELRARLDEPSEVGEAIDEVLNIMSTHALTALAKMENTALRPNGLTIHRGTTPALVQSLALREDAIARVAHARLSLEGVLRGVDLAIIDGGLP